MAHHLPLVGLLKEFRCNCNKFDAFDGVRHFWSDFKNWHHIHVCVNYQLIGITLYHDYYCDLLSDLGPGSFLVSFHSKTGIK